MNAEKRLSAVRRRPSLRGGDYALDNLMLVCPNHHRAIHRCDAPLDWGDLAYDFGTHREAVAMDRHLEPSVG
jgi:5-methylcytosine-specific restriction protein A